MTNSQPKRRGHKNGVHKHIRINIGHWLNIGKDISARGLWTVKCGSCSDSQPSYVIIGQM